ncbi:hypothetical protein ACFL3T_05490, partial [Patescibacteria group bacterium]
FGIDKFEGCPVADFNIVNLHTVSLGGGGTTVEPAHGYVKVFDRNDVEFQTLYTKNPNKSEYATVFEADVGLISSCTTDTKGTCFAYEDQIGDYLVIVLYKDKETRASVFTGLPKSPTDFISDINGDGVADYATKEFDIIKVIKKDGTVEWKGGIRTVLHGSQLDVIYPIDAQWDEGSLSYVYPFIFTSDDNWEVDLCARVPQGYEVAGTYDENGNLVTSESCYQTFVAGETKVVAFDVVQTGSPPEWAMNVKLKAKGPNGKAQNLNLDVPSHVYEHARGVPFGNNPVHN